MVSHWIGGVTVAIASLVAAPGARADSDSCWRMIGKALQSSARAPHAPFITYAERATIVEDGKTLEHITSNITYRDDGIAYVDDDRWTLPFLSARPQPGPPVLGPYGGSRSAWLSFGTQTTSLPIIADVYNKPRETCRDAAASTGELRQDRHLIVGVEHPNRVGLHEIWIDPVRLEIARVVVRGPVPFYAESDPKPGLTNFEVDMEQVDGYSVVQRVAWQYREHIYDQWSDLAAEYDFGDYRFSATPPPETLAIWNRLK